MIFKDLPNNIDPLRLALLNAYRMDENQCVENLLNNINISSDQKQRISDCAYQLVNEVRKERMGKSGLDSFLHLYHLSSEEGIALMCMAEALLRIPDKDTIDKLIKDKITSADWAANLGKSDSMFVNAATWGLMLTGKIMSSEKEETGAIKSALKKLIERSGEPVIRKAVMHAMKIMGKQFVMGRNIKEALERAKEYEAQGYYFSYDMLGEAARTAKDAERYYKSYENAIHEIYLVAKNKNMLENPGISIKLSALYPRYEFAQKHKAVPAVAEKLLSLSLLAKQANISLTVDAEEADRLDLSLDIIEKVFSDHSLNGWEGFGLAVQSYQKRAWYLIDWLAQLSRKNKRKIMVRLIKGAYWDSEIKISQERGFENYPVFTRKSSTDVSFIACAQKIIAHSDAIYPQFATHNAHSVATILTLMGERTDYEFQCLHGMGHALYDQIVGKNKMNRPCRVYAPVGSHEDLLPYLVRRLLENGANSSFVNRIVDANLPIEELIVDPVTKTRALFEKPNPKIPSPINLFSSERLNSKGLDLSNQIILSELADKMTKALDKPWHAKPSVQSEKDQSTEASAIYDPSDKRRLVGWVTESNAEQIEETLKRSAAVAISWNKTAVTKRAETLEKLADLFEENYPVLMALCIREAGKSIPDSVAEIREAIDFCRYYAVEARKIFSQKQLPGPTGELNQLSLSARGPIVCISPWNFPLAIFTGQVVAALAAGNPVIAKPAEQTPLIASFAVELMHKAGIPKDVIQLLPGRGEIVGAKLVADLRVKAVVFTGSTDTARAINKTLAERAGAIIPLIAETGGQNAMIVDSSALPEQVVMDVINSAFNSAGQRCSALRILFLQDDIADKVIEMLKGAMAELYVNDPSFLSTDIGPVIDNDAKSMLEAHAERMSKEAKLIYQVNLNSDSLHGNFFAPRAYEINVLSQLSKEVFGPILHIIRFKAKDLDKVIQDINQTGYGLTLGIHSRINDTVEKIISEVHVGNCYVNRNMIGAVVGVQPFGGEGLSGTGPKAGGPHYLYRLCTEKSVSINTTAAGGNASLMCVGE